MICLASSSSSTQAPNVIFSGIQSSGIPHLGNYLGALTQWTALQSAHDTSVLYSVVGMLNMVLLHDDVIIFCVILIFFWVFCNNCVSHSQSSTAWHTTEAYEPHLSLSDWRTDARTHRLTDRSSLHYCASEAEWAERKHFRLDHHAACMRCRSRPQHYIPAIQGTAPICMHRVLKQQLHAGCTACWAGVDSWLHYFNWCIKQNDSVES